MADALQHSVVEAAEQIERFPGERVIVTASEIAKRNFALHFKEWVIVGVRGMTFQKDKGFIPNADEIDLYNDSLILLRQNNKDLEWHVYRCTMDPGLYWIQNPMAPGGAARLEPGLYIYQKGWHRGHEAFTQFQKVAVRRDRNLNGIWEEAEPVQQGFFGINIHASYTKGTVGQTSAGCTAIDGGWNSKEWKTFKNTLYSSGQLRYPYAVLSPKQRKELVAVV